MNKIRDDFYNLQRIKEQIDDIGIDMTNLNNRYVSEKNHLLCSIFSKNGNEKGKLFYENMKMQMVLLNDHRTTEWDDLDKITRIEYILIAHDYFNIK